MIPPSVAVQMRAVDFPRAVEIMTVIPLYNADGNDQSRMSTFT